MLLEDLWQHRNWTPSPKSPIPPTLDEKAQAEQCLRDNAGRFLDWGAVTYESLEASGCVVDVNEAIGISVEE